MLFKKKLPILDRELLDLHKSEIIKKLQFKYVPVVLYGDEAFTFARENLPGYHKKSDKQMRGGYFHYEELPPKYYNTGVVLIFNGEIGTLAHELRHARQYQDKNRWMKRGKWLMFLYKTIYVFYPTEWDAFRYAATYLTNSKLRKAAFWYKFWIALNITAYLLVPLIFICLYFFS
ncbi:hypothetical protein [Psychrobacillus sp. FSL H8-0487]|uniref:hypothetical protein n=1 Tax=Psychrobacillus sp. FSL H8-0487 TaxID=2921391 RepID=UPI0030F4E094